MKTLLIGCLLWAITAPIWAQADKRADLEKWLEAQKKAAKIPATKTAPAAPRLPAPGLVAPDAAQKFVWAPFAAMLSEVRDDGTIRISQTGPLNVSGKAFPVGTIRELTIRIRGMDGDAISTPDEIKKACALLEAVMVARCSISARVIVKKYYEKQPDREITTKVGPMPRPPTPVRIPMPDKLVRAIPVQFDAPDISITIPPCKECKGGANLIGQLVSGATLKRELPRSESGR